MVRPLYPIVPYKWMVFSYRTDSSLVYGTGSLGELLLTAIPEQLAWQSIQYFGPETSVVVIAK